MSNLCRHVKTLLVCAMFGCAAEAPPISAGRIDQASITVTMACNGSFIDTTSNWTVVNYTPTSVGALKSKINSYSNTSVPIKLVIPPGTYTDSSTCLDFSSFNGSPPAGGPYPVWVWVGTGSTPGTATLS